jgi:hypothetical protein
MAVTVVQQVSTGAVVLFAASEPDKLDVSTPVLPLSAESRTRGHRQQREVGNPGSLRSR